MLRTSSTLAGHREKAKKASEAAYILYDVVVSHDAHSHIPPDVQVSAMVRKMTRLNRRILESRLLLVNESSLPSLSPLRIFLEDYRQIVLVSQDARSSI